MLMYCKKCGRVIKDSESCDICGSITYQVPTQYLRKDMNFLIENKLKDQFIKECIKSSPEFDEELFNNHDKIKIQKSVEQERAIAIGNAIYQGADVKTAFRNGGKNMPKCPACGSLNIHNIPDSDRIIFIGYSNVFTDKNNKTFKCNNCGYSW